MGYLVKSLVEAVSGFHGLYNDCVTVGSSVGLLQEVVSCLTGGRVDLAGYVLILIGFGVVRYSFVK